MAEAFIYSLACPYTKKIKYVGKTVKPLRERLNGHNICANSNVSKWARKLNTQNRKPIIELIDIVDEDEVNYWERYWIHQFIIWGFNLLNHTHTNFSSNMEVKFRRTEEYVIPELRIKKPTLEEYTYVFNLAKKNKRSLPAQLEVIIEEMIAKYKKDGTLKPLKPIDIENFKNNNFSLGQKWARR